MLTADRHLRTSLVAALIIFLVGTIVYLVANVEGVLYMQAQTLQSPEVFDYVPSVLGTTVPLALWRMVPLAIGAFLSFWLVMPIRASRRLPGAIGTVAVAVVIGTVLTLIVYTIRLLVDNRPALSADPVDPRFFVLLAGTVLNEAWSILSATYALVAAVGLGAWGGLVRSRPRDEVAEAPAQPVSDS